MYFINITTDCNGIRTIENIFKFFVFEVETPIDIAPIVFFKFLSCEKRGFC
jgi:hypothetical protein